MHELVVFQVAGHSAPVVEHSRCSGVVPMLGDGEQSSQHVRQSPEAEPPENAAAESGAVVDTDHGNDDDREDGDIEEEFVVVSHGDKDGGNREVDDREDQDLVELPASRDFVHPF